MKWTLTELSGRADLVVECDATEGVPAICRSAVEELGMRGLLPPAITVTDLAASRDLGNIADGTVRCSVHWVADVEGHSDRTAPDDTLVGSGRDEWPDVWSEYRRIFDLLKMAEPEAWQTIAWAVRIASALGVATNADAMADALKEFVVLCRERRGVVDNARGELAAAVIQLRAASDENERRETAVALFGTSGERLHSVLAKLDIRSRP